MDANPGANDSQRSRSRGAPHLPVADSSHTAVAIRSSSSARPSDAIEPLRSNLQKRLRDPEGDLATAGTAPPPSRPTLRFAFQLPVTVATDSQLAVPSYSYRCQEGNDNFPPRCIIVAAKLCANRPARGHRSLPLGWKKGDDASPRPSGGRRSFQFGGSLPQPTESDARPPIDPSIGPTNPHRCSESLAELLLRDSAVLVQPWNEPTLSVGYRLPDLPPWPTDQEETVPPGYRPWATLAQSLVSLYRLLHALETSLWEEASVQERNRTASSKGVRTRSQQQLASQPATVESALGKASGEVHVVWLYLLTHWPLAVLSLGYVDWWLRESLWDEVMALAGPPQEEPMPTEKTTTLGHAMAVWATDLYGSVLDLLHQLPWEDTAAAGTVFSAAAAAPGVAAEIGTASPPRALLAPHPTTADLEGIVATATPSFGGRTADAVQPNNHRARTAAFALAAVQTLYSLYVEPPPVLAKTVGDRQRSSILLFTLCCMGNAVPVHALEHHSGNISQQPEAPLRGTWADATTAQTLLRTMSITMSLASLAAARLVGLPLEIKSDVTRFVGRLMRLQAVFAEGGGGDDIRVRRPLKTPGTFAAELERLQFVLSTAK